MDAGADCSSGEAAGVDVSPVWELPLLLHWLLHLYLAPEDVQALKLG